MQGLDSAKGFTTDDLPGLRSLLGRSAAFWAGESGVRVEDGRWVALSGARAADYNVVMCHGASGDGLLVRSMEEIAEAGVPALVIVAGETLGDVHCLIEAGWVCIGSLPFMAAELDGYAGRSEEGPNPPTRGAARRLAGAEVDAARALVEEVYGIDRELARVALPREACSRPGHSVWGAFDDRGDLVSCVGTVRVHDAVTGWSMATAVGARGRGHGARLLRAVLADAALSGARTALLHSSRAGKNLYHTHGYRVLEHWQVWSRPRWVLGRT
jgi:ribosomal protein S18 acetylase RimI-like enzyme